MSDILLQFAGLGILLGGIWLGYRVARISGEILVWLFPGNTVRGEVGPFARPVMFENLFNWFFKTQAPL